MMELDYKEKSKRYTGGFKSFYQTDDTYPICCISDYMYDHYEQIQRSKTYLILFVKLHL